MAVLEHKAVIIQVKSKLVAICILLVTVISFCSVWFGIVTKIILTGRRIAELEMYIALSHIMKNFSVEFPERAPMDYILKGFLIPERQLNLIFHDLIK